MGSPAIFSGRRTKLLTADGILNSDGSINDYDGMINVIPNGHAEIDTTGWSTYSDSFVLTSTDTVGEQVNVRNKVTGTTVAPYLGQPLYYYGTTPSGGLSLNTTYYVAGTVSGSGTTVDPYAFGLSSTPGGSVINLTSNAGANLSYFAPLQPVGANGTVETPTITWTRSTSSPLFGQASFLYTKTAALSAGQGVVYPFTIPTALQGQRIAIQDYYQIASGTYATGELTVWIKDVTNNRIIQPDAYQIENVGVVSRSQPMTFQASIDSTSYALILHVSGTSTSANTVKFDNFSVGPQVVPSGYAGSDWVSYTPTGTWVANTTYTGFWKRLGDTMLIRAQVSLTGAPSGTFTLNLPSGYTIDTTKLGSSLQSYTQNLGSAQMLVTGSSWDAAMVGYGSSTSVTIWSLASGTTNGFTQVTSSQPASFQNADGLWLDFKVPIVGWSSNVVSSDSAASRAVAASYRFTSNQAISAGTTVTLAPTTQSVDTHGMYSAGVFTIKVPGIYRISQTIYFGAGESFSSQATSLNCYYRIDGGALQGPLDIVQPPNTSAYYFVAKGSDLRQLNAGQTIEFRTQNTDANTHTVSQGNITVELDQGPSQIQAATEVTVAYRNIAGSTINTSSTTFLFPTKGVDTTLSYNTSTGTFTAPAPGRYEYNTSVGLGVNLSSTQSVEINAFVNGVSDKIGRAPGTGGTVLLIASVQNIVELQAGGTIRFEASSAVSGASDTRVCTMTIKRLGGIN